MITREEILAVYAAGPEAVVRLVLSLAQRLEAHEARLRELEHRLAKDSHNSHKPPSSDGLSRGKKPKSLRGKSGKRSGGQPGHPGQTLRPVEKPDERQAYAPSTCTHCGGSLEAVEPSSRETRQVFDLPPLSLFVTEHEAQTKRCPACQHCTAGRFPAEVTQPVQYGPGVRGLSVYLQTYQLLPFARTQELLRDLFGTSPGQGTLARALDEAAERLEPVEEVIRQAIHQAPVVHFDETGIRSQAKLCWLHVAGTETCTFYAVHPKRGRQAHESIGILPGFGGTAVHDAYASFLTYPGRHALCNAHLLRELIAQEEETRQPWATAMILLLQEMKQAVETARSGGATPLRPDVLQALEGRYRCILEHGHAAHPPPPPTRRKGRRKQSPARNLLDRLQRHQGAVLAFLYDFEVPFDNNLAERDLRMAKVQQKISGGFRSAEGAEHFCRIRGYISTLRKQGLHVLSALQSVFAGTPLMPQLQG
jgi:transposase